MQPVNQTGAAALLEALIGGPKAGQDGAIGGSVFSALFESGAAPGLQIASSKSPATPSGAALGLNAILAGAASVEGEITTEAATESSSESLAATAAVGPVEPSLADLLTAEVEENAESGAIAIDPELVEGAVLVEANSIIVDGEAVIETVGAETDDSGDDIENAGEIATAAITEPETDEDAAITPTGPVILNSASGEAVAAAAQGADKSVPGAVADAVVPLTPAGAHNPHYNGSLSTESDEPAAAAPPVTSAPVPVQTSDKGAENRATSATPAPNAAPTGIAAADGDESSGFAGNDNADQRQNAQNAATAPKAGGSSIAGGEPTVIDPASAPTARPTFDPAGTLPAIARGLDAVMPEGTALARAASATSQVFVPAARLTDTVGLRISRAIQDGESKFMIRIDPPELGRIEVKLEFSTDNRLRATMVAENREALNILQRDAASLEKALNEAGVKADAGSLNFSLKEQGDGHRASAFADSDDAEVEPAGTGDIDLSDDAANIIAQRAASHRLVDLSV